MKQIGLITLYKANYGSILQCYSTKKYVESLGHKVCVIDSLYIPSRYKKITSLINHLICSVLYRDYFNTIIGNKKAMKLESKIVSPNALQKMDMFIKKSINPSFIDERDLESVGEKMDAFIVGSDQVWNASRKINDMYMLGFTDKSKRIALAPSFGVDRIPSFNIRKIKEGISGFSVLSCREETGVDLVKNLTGRNALRLPDPTILLDKEQWVRFGTHSDIEMSDERFIVVHFLNKPSELAINTIKQFSKIYNKKIVIISNYYEELNFENSVKVDASPYDYIKLINEADMILTDSFHTTLFSLNLEKRFMTFERMYLHSNSQQSRIEDLLERIHMKNHFIQNPIEDFSEILREKWDSDVLFSSERKIIKEYLNEELARTLERLNK